MSQLDQPQPVFRNGDVTFDPGLDVRRAPAVGASIKEIPYDYVARFLLSGSRGHRVQDVINISIEGAFVAVAIAYSVIPDKDDGTTDTAATPPSSVTLATPRRQLLDRMSPIHFKYSIVDSGSGRELQNIPIHNLVGLGSADGHRPFRPFAKPMVFMPRSTIRFEVEEISDNQGLLKNAELFIALHGYKILGYGVAP